MSDAANLDNRGREPGTGLTPDKKEARVDRGTGSDASAALAALGGGPGLQSCNRAASHGVIVRARPTVARVRTHDDHPLGLIAK